MNPNKFELFFDSAEPLYRSIAAANISRGTDEYRPLLTGILFEFEADLIRLVATDSYRLCVAEIPVPWLLPEETAVIGGDYKALLAMLKAAKNTELTLTANEKDDYIFTANGASITMTTIQGTYPDYRQLIPAEFSNEGVSYNPKYLSDIGKAAMLFTGETAKNCTTPVKLQTDSQKPGLFRTVSHENGELQQLLMPVRG